MVFAAWAVFLRGQLAELERYTWRIAPGVLGLATLWAALYFGGLALCWAILLRQITGDKVQGSLLATMRVWLLSMSTRYIPGNIWHILSRVALAGSLKVSKTQVLTSATVEQLLTLLGAVTLAGATLPFWNTTGVEQTWFLLVPAGLIFMHPRVLGFALSWAAVRFQRPTLVWSYRYHEVLVFLLAYCGATFFAGCALVTLVWGLSAVTLGDMPLLIGAAALSWTAGYLSLLTPSGLGVREAVLVALLAISYPLPVAIISSLLFRVVLTAGEFLVVAIMWVVVPRNKPRNAPQSNGRGDTR
jgi:hypothetical protein